MRRRLILVLSGLFVFTGLGFAPAHATSTYNGTSGVVSCSTSGTFTIADNIVTSSTNCSGLVEIPFGVTTIGIDAFSLQFLTSVSIPDSVTSIGVRAFYGNQITRVELSRNLQFIAMDAFRGNQLTHLTIPNTVTEIGEFGFAENQILSNVTFLGNAPLTEHRDIFFFSDPALNIDVHAEAAGWGATFSGVPVRRNFLTTFDSNSGTSVSSQRFSTGLAVTAPTAPTRAGHTFDGWSATNGGPTVSFPYNPGVAANVTLFAKWTEIPVVVTPPTGPPPAALPTVDLVAQAAAADLAARTFKSKSRFAIKPLAKRVGVQMVSPRAKVTFRVAKASRKVCTKSGTRIRTLRPGNCVVTFTVKEPRPKKGKAPRATRTVKTLVIQ